MTEPWSRLKHQSRARAISADEHALAQALESAFKDGVSDFAEVARRLTAAGIVAPSSRRTNWDIALLQSELDQINRSLDDAYARHGIGA
jgi:hypothetical protein